MSEPTEWEADDDEGSWYRDVGPFVLLAHPGCRGFSWSVEDKDIDADQTLDAGNAPDLPTAKKDAGRAMRRILLAALADLGPEEPEGAEMAVYDVLDEDIDHEE